MVKYLIIMKSSLFFGSGPSTDLSLLENEAMLREIRPERLRRSKDIDGSTYLHLAAKFNKCNIISFLLEKDRIDGNHSYSKEGVSCISSETE